MRPNLCLTYSVYIVVVVFSHLASSQSFAQTPSYTVYTTNLQVNSQPDFEPVEQFDCSDRIYIVLEGLNLENKAHQLKVRWQDPAGEQKELTRYSFQGYAFTRIWAWLQLNPPTGAVIGQIFDPSFGMEHFIGEWLATVEVDGKEIAKHPFDVLC